MRVNRSAMMSLHSRLGGGPDASCMPLMMHACHEYRASAHYQETV